MADNGKGVDTAREALGNGMECATDVADKEIDAAVKVLIRFWKGVTGA